MVSPLLSLDKKNADTFRTVLAYLWLFSFQKECALERDLQLLLALGGKVSLRHGVKLLSPSTAFANLACILITSLFSDHRVIDVRAFSSAVQAFSISSSSLIDPNLA